MKKTLIAVAALAATGVFAQNVTIYGTFDPSVAHQTTTYGDGTSISQNKLLNNTQATSAVIFKGSDDLGGGLQAIWLIENDFDAALNENGNGIKESVTSGSASSTSTGTYSNFGSRGGELYAGLTSSSLGTLKLGGANNPSLDVQAGGISQPFGTKIGGGFGFLYDGHVRDSNSVKYETPVFSGFQAKIGYAFKSKADGDSAAASTTGITTGAATGAAARTDIGLFYNNGPLAVAYSNYTIGSYDAQNGGTTNASLTTTNIAATKNNNLVAGYDFGVVKLGAGYYTTKADAYTSTAGTAVAARDWKSYNLSASVPLGSPNLLLLANYGKRDDRGVSNQDGTVAAVGLKYILSKRTSVYARYVNYKVDNVTTSTGIAKQTTTAVGIQTNF